jgi:hypothetical protein
MPRGSGQAIPAQPPQTLCGGGCVRLREEDCRIGCGGRLFPPAHDCRAAALHPPHARAIPRTLTAGAVVANVHRGLTLAGKLIDAALPKLA